MEKANQAFQLKGTIHELCQDHQEELNTLYADTLVKHNTILIYFI